MGRAYKEFKSYPIDYGATCTQPVHREINL